jgi:hypothetical protein
MCLSRYLRAAASKGTEDRIAPSHHAVLGLGVTEEEAMRLLLFVVVGAAVGLAALSVYCRHYANHRGPCFEYDDSSIWHY